VAFELETGVGSLRDTAFDAPIDIRGASLSAGAPLCRNSSLAAIRQFSVMLDHAAATSLVIVND
jgi:hypothetical protein